MEEKIRRWRTCNGITITDNGREDELIVRNEIKNTEIMEEKMN